MRAEEWLDDIPADGLVGNVVVQITVCDNVLDEEDWPIHVIFIENMKVKRQEVMRKGIYTMPDFRGKKAADVVRWVNQNRTMRPEEHPQVWHELMFVKGGKHVTV